ncbi:MAG: WecB/TagA/CpsF family glycosyltransferase [Gammaproteobacteria bacterium]|nr:WecB/TagA/CpsF family glycosyltransferase [Gammaproteobacteria bacterium]
MKLVLEFDDQDLAGALARVADFGAASFGYVVTPNVDHVIRYADDAGFRDAYRGASFVFIDSRILARLLRVVRGQSVRVCTGSDLTAAVLARLVGAEDRLVLVGGSTAQAANLRERYGLPALVHVSPPMGFVHDHDALEDCLQAIERASPFRFCFLAVGSPQQEIVAQRLRARARARGLALCIGASVNFLTGAERRAPVWMQHAGLEWLYRLVSSPRRLASRYLLRGPRIFRLLRRLELRPREPQRSSASRAPPELGEDDQTT